jgi:hypothetical protein
LRRREVKSVKKLVKALLNAMDRVYEDYPEVTDTEVRVCMRKAITDGFIDPKPGYILPDEFGMAGEEGEAKVKAALARFLAKARAQAAKAGLSTPEARLRAFQGDVQSNDGSEYDLYFNHVDRV